MNRERVGGEGGEARLHSTAFWSGGAAAQSRAPTRQFHARRLRLDAITPARFIEPYTGRAPLWATFLASSGGVRQRFFNPPSLPPHEVAPARVLIGKLTSSPSQVLQAAPRPGGGVRADGHAPRPSEQSLLGRSPAILQAALRVLQGAFAGGGGEGSAGGGAVSAPHPAFAYLHTYIHYSDARHHTNSPSTPPSLQSAFAGVGGEGATGGGQAISPPSTATFSRTRLPAHRPTPLFAGATSTGCNLPARRRCTASLAMTHPPSHSHSHLPSYLHSHLKHTSFTGAR